MFRSDRISSFFNRSHAIQGFQLLAAVFWLFAFTFPVLDLIRVGHVRPITAVWGLTAAALSGAATVLSRRIRSGILPVAAGVAMSAGYLGIAWASAWWSQ
jgi:hypothetical protein